MWDPDARPPVLGGAPQAWTGSVMATPAWRLLQRPPSAVRPQGWAAVQPLSRPPMGTVAARPRFARCPPASLPPPEFREDLRLWIDTHRRVELRIMDLVEAVFRIHSGESAGPSRSGVSEQLCGPAGTRRSIDSWAGRAGAVRASPARHARLRPMTAPCPPAP